MVKEPTVTDVHELLMYAVERMATKEDIASIREEMATKGELVATREEMHASFAVLREEMATKIEMSAGFASVRSEISEVKQQIKDLEEVVQDHSGFAQEIDHNLARTGALEQHVGLRTS